MDPGGCMCARILNVNERPENACMFVRAKNLTVKFTLSRRDAQSFFLYYHVKIYKRLVETDGWTRRDGAKSLRFFYTD